MDKDNDNRNKTISFVMIALILLVLLGFAMYNIQSLKDQLKGSQSTIESISSDLVTYRDKDSCQVAEKEMILSSYSALKKIHAGDSSEIGKLMKIIAKNTISAAIVTNKTSGKATGKTKVSFEENLDPPVQDINYETIQYPTDTIYPTYQDSVSDKWATIKTIANKDSITVDYTIHNEYEVIGEFKKVGKWPFRRQVPYLKVKNLNPHTETTEIASYAVQTPKQGKKIALVSGISAVVGLIIGILLVK